MGKTVQNHKHVIDHSLKYHKNCASDVNSEAYTTQEDNTRLLDQVKMIKTIEQWYNR